MKKFIKKTIKKITNDLPGVQNALRNGVKALRRMRNSLSLVGSDHSRAYTPAYRISLPLDRIAFCNLVVGNPGPTKLNTIAGESIVAAGDWDQLRLPLKEMPLYQSIRAYLLEDKDLRDTPVFAGRAHDEKQITSGSWHAVYDQNLEAKKAKIDDIYHSIKNHGYLSQIELGTDRPYDEITVRIARDGEFLLENSIHRTIIAKIIGLDTVPVVVSARHSDWMRMRARFIDFAFDREGGKMYGKLSHPDLWDVPHAHALDDRIGLIAQHLQSNRGNALDLGCDTGLFSQFLDRAGHDVYAVERDPELANIARLMNDIEGLSIQFILGDILDDDVVRQYEGRHYSVVLTLNILHHFLKKQERVEKLRRILQSLQMDQLFLQCHRQDEPQMQSAYMNPSPDEFARFIIDNSCLSKFEKIGVGADGRTMMVLK